MKFFGKIIIQVFLGLALSACTGTVDDTLRPILSATDQEIDLSVETNTVFTVTYNGVDVTADSEVVSISGAEGLQGNVFTPATVGSFEFQATYNGVDSEPVIVNVTDTDTVVETKFRRHVCIMEFTGSWCINCPKGFDRLNSVLDSPDMEEYRGQLHMCAFHNGNDVMAIPATDVIMRMFPSLDFPSFVIDLRGDHSGVLTEESGRAKIRPGIFASFDEYSCHCGVSVSSVPDQERESAEVTVKVRSELTGRYTVVLLVVQDKIRGYQLGDFGENNNYNHRHVVRRVVTEYGSSFSGEKITDDGVIREDEEASRMWTVDLEDEWVLDNTQVYALVLDADGYVNNMNVCAIDGGDSGYDFK